MNTAHAPSGKFAKRDPEIDHEITRLAISWYNSLKQEHELSEALDYIHDTPEQIGEIHARISKTLQYERRLLSKLREVTSG